MQAEKQDYLVECDEKEEDIQFMLSVIREIYALAGEDKAISMLCNRILQESRIAIDRS